MKKIQKLSILIILILFCSIIFFKTPTIKSENIIIVDINGSGNYTKIQDAIDNASEGYTILVSNGIYDENIIINKSITLRGEDKNLTTIAINKTGKVIDVVTDNVIISDFKIIGHPNNKSIGIYLNNSNNSTISECLIYNHSNEKNSTGIYLLDSSNNTIKNCNISNNSIGINISYNKSCSSDNTVFNNIFENNSIHAVDFCNNNWDNGYSIGGNHWDDYGGYDYYHGPNQDLKGSDLIGDNSYNIPFESKDNYPLLKPIDNINSTEVIIEEIIEPSSGYTGNYKVKTKLKTVKIDVDGIKNSNEPWLEHFDSPDENESLEPSQPSFNFYTSRSEEYMYLAFENHNPENPNRAIDEINLYIDANDNGIWDDNDSEFFIYKETSNIYSSEYEAPLANSSSDWNESIIEIKILKDYWDNCNPWAYKVISWSDSLSNNFNPSWENLSYDFPPDFIKFPCNCKITFDILVKIFNVDSPEPVLVYKDNSSETLYFNSTLTREFSDWNVKQDGDYRIKISTNENKPWLGSDNKIKSIIINQQDEIDTDPPSPHIIVNKPPTADASRSDNQGYPDEKLKFDGSLSYDDGEIINYTWDFGDGTKGYGMIVNHTFTKNNTYNVTLKVTDDDRETDEDTVEVIILKANNPPEAPKITGPSEGDENQSYEFTAISSDKDNDTIQYIFNWDDKNTSTTNFLLNNTLAKKSHKWMSQGTYTISVRAYDGMDKSKSSKITISIKSSTDTLDTNGGTNDPGGDGNNIEKSSNEKEEDITKTVVAVVPIATLGLLGGIYVSLSESGRYKLFSLLLGLGPLFTRIRKDEALDQEVRGDVYNYIEDNPGAYYTNIMRNVGVGNGTISHHLRMLEQMNMIKSRREGLRYRAFYITQKKFPEKEKDRLTNLQSKILGEIKKKEGIPQTELTSILGQKQQTINYNVKKLERDGLIRLEKKSGKTYCFLKH